VTGNYRKAGIVPPTDAPNVTFTGFLADPDYVALLGRADVVIVLTSDDDLLNCGAYEALALDKPLILSDTKAIREYSGWGCPRQNDADGTFGPCAISHPRR
jgi:glycosyltransferase involved in cell wall biosynthesis